MRANDSHMSTRILIVYHEGVSTEKFDPLKRRLEEKYQNEHLPIYHVPAEGLQVFMEGNGEFSIMFVQEELPIQIIHPYRTEKTRVVHGVTLESADVIKFFSSL